jgi:hypothetical protein
MVNAIIAIYGTTFCQELNINIKDGSAASLFQLLCTSVLFGDRVDWVTTISAARLMRQRGLTLSPQNMAAATYEKLLQVLREGGYVLYNLDESAARSLGEMTQAVFDRYNGDVGNLRERAGHSPDKERRLLEEFRGMGDAGIGWFFREAQDIWDELYPYIDHKGIEAAHELGLPDDSAVLARLCRRSDFTKLAAGLVRVALRWDYPAIIDKAKELQATSV